MISIAEKFAGAMIGSICGDILGAPVEFMEVEKILKTYDGPLTGYVSGGWLDVEVGEYTDDTQMSLAIIRSIVEKERVDCDDIANKFVDWYLTMPKDIGSTTQESLKLIYKGTPWWRASIWAMGNSQFAGNGSLMRTAPIGVFGTNLREIISNAISVGIITHYDIRCQVCCAVFSVFLNDILYNNGNTNFKSSVFKAEKLLMQLGHYEMAEMCHNFPELYFKPTGYVMDTLMSAVWCLQKTDNFKDALLMAVNSGGDTDTVGAVTGALAGAKYGYVGIPIEWKEQMQNAGEITDLINKFWDVNISRLASIK